MALTSQVELAQLTVLVPRSQDAFWQIMRGLDAKGAPFSITDVADQANRASRYSVEHYLQRLTRGGFAKVVGKRLAPGTSRPEHLFRLLKRPVPAPRLRKDGKPLPPSAQTRLWRAMRTPRGRAFAAVDVAFEASLPGAKVPLLTARRYCNQLCIAGYLSRRGGCFRLMPSMDTGPLPPSILKTEAVWDRNLKKLFGPDVHDAAEVA